MDYLETFLPILSSAFHDAGPSLPVVGRDRADETPEGGKTTAIVIERLVRQARRRRTPGNAGYFDLALLAVDACVYYRLGISLPLVPGPGDPSNCRRDFFAGLDRLLAAADAEGANPDRAGALRVFLVCLELGFAGDGEEAADYRRRCRRALRKSLPPKTVTVFPDFALPASSETSGRFALLAWSLPPAVIGCLYVAYRMLLADMLPG